MSLSVDVNNIKQEYFNAKEETFLQMASLPTYSNDEGSVYLINNNNLHLLKESTFSTDFKEQKEDDFKWFLNRYAVYICNTEYLLNKFIKIIIFFELLVYFSKFII